MERQRHPNRYYKSFYERAPIGLYTTDVTTGEFIMVNPAAAKMLGFNNPKELLESNLKSTDFYDVKTRKSFIGAIKKCGEVHEFEIQLTLPQTGKKIWVQASGTFCEDNECIQGSITDITARKEMEKEIEQLRESSIIMLEKINQQAKGRLARMNEETLYSRRS